MRLIQPSFWSTRTSTLTAQPMSRTTTERLRRVTYPHECRVSDLTYASDIYVDVAVYLGGKDVQHHKGVKIGRIPIMLGSVKCNLIGRTEKEI